MNVRVSVGGEDNDSSDSDSELAQVKQKVEDEGDPWAANEDDGDDLALRPPEENLLLSAAKGEAGLGFGGDDVSHRVRKYEAICFHLTGWCIRSDRRLG